MCVAKARESKSKVKTIGSDGQIRTVPFSAPEEPPSAAQLVAEKLHVPYQAGGDNGSMTAAQAGEIGGHLGGPMVAKLVALARSEMANAHVDELISRQKEKATQKSR